MKRTQQLPKGWRSVKLRSLLRRYTTKGCPDWPLLSVTREQGVILRNTESKEENHNYIPDDLSKYKAVEEGDFVINKMKAWQGSYGVSPRNGIVSPAYYTYHFASDEVLPAFFHVALRSRAYVDSFAAVSKGIRIGQWDMDENKMREIAFSIPSLAEQARIVSYVESKNSEIDALVERREQVIAHLQELKQSIIAHAVTKGLNPDSPTKDSGVPWLGQVPAHWQPVRTKQLLVQVKKRAGESHASLPLLSLTKQGVILRDVESGKGKFSEDMSRFWCVEPGNFIFCHFDVQETPRTVGISAHRGMITGAYAIYRYNGEVPSFFYYLHEFLDDGKRLRSLYTGLRNVIKKERFLSMPVFMPSVEEQQAIVAYLDAKCAAIDELMARHRAMIERLKELKTSLIAAAVTGKIDVR